MRDDQAAGLRRLFAPRAARVLLITYASWPQRGWLALNLAAAISRTGEQAVILDSERESISLLWGAGSRYELAHVFDGDRRLSQVVVPGPAASAIVPMRRAGATLARQGRGGQRALAEALGGLIDEGAVLVVPVAPPALISPLWRFAGTEQLVCVGNGSAAITGAYAAIKSALGQQASIRVALSPDSVGATERFAHLAGVTRQFLDAEILYGGSLPATELAEGTPGLTLFDESAAAAAAVQELAASACGWNLPQIDMATRFAGIRGESSLVV